MAQRNAPVVEPKKIHVNIVVKQEHTADDNCSTQSSSNHIQSTSKNLAMDEMINTDLDSPLGSPY